MHIEFTFEDRKRWRISAGASVHCAHACATAVWSGAIHPEMVKKEGSVHISAKNEWARHSEANTAAREVGESRATPSVSAPVLVLHRSKHSA